MLSSLNSETAIEINVAIMRTFIKLRSAQISDKSGSNQIFSIIFERLDDLDGRLAINEDELKPVLEKSRKKIGLKF